MGTHLFRPILLTDCCSLFSAILNLQPKSVEKFGKITLSHLRDVKSLITISFIDATCNLADIATKHADNLPILDRFFARCRFAISFLGRKDRKTDSPPTKETTPLKRVDVNSRANSYCSSESSRALYAG